MLGELITGIFGAANNSANIGAAQQANRENIALQRENRDWMQNMAASTHVREVADLKAAGLNPVLSAGGGGAPSPSSAAAQVEAPKSENVGKMFSDAFTEGAHRSLLENQAKVAGSNAVTAGAQASVAAGKAKEELRGQKAKNAWTETQTAIAKSLAPQRQEGMKASSEAGGMWKAGRSVLNRLQQSAAGEFMTDGHLGSDLYDFLHKGE